MIIIYVEQDVNFPWQSHSGLKVENKKKCSTIFYKFSSAVRMEWVNNRTSNYPIREKIKVSAIYSERATCSIILPNLVKLHKNDVCITVQQQCNETSDLLVPTNLKALCSFCAYHCFVPPSSFSLCPCWQLGQSHKIIPEHTGTHTHHDGAWVY